MDWTGLDWRLKGVRNSSLERLALCGLGFGRASEKAGRRNLCPKPNRMRMRMRMSVDGRSVGHWLLDLFSSPSHRVSSVRSAGLLPFPVLVVVLESSVTV